MGGAMTLHLGETFVNEQQRPDALCTIAAPVFLNDLKEGVITNWLYYITRTVALFVSSIHGDIHCGKDVENDGDEQWIGYKGVFIRTGLSFLYALKGIKQNLSGLTQPILMIHDYRDKTVSSKNLPYIYAHVGSKEKEYLLTHMEKEHNRHVLLMYKSIQQELIEKILSFFDIH
jgi:esterase/lipase